MIVLEHDYVSDVCASYPETKKPTIRGLAGRLDMCYETLHRVEKSEYRPGSAYRENRPAYNRKINSSDFRTVQKATERIRERTYCKQGGYFSPV